MGAREGGVVVVVVMMMVVVVVARLARQVVLHAGEHHRDAQVRQLGRVLRAAARRHAFLACRHRAAHRLAAPRLVA